VGGYVYDSEDPELDAAQLYVIALGPDGSVAWVLPGHGPWYPEPASLFLTEAGELVLVALSGGSELALGDLPIPDYEYQPILVRIGLDGTPLGHQPILDPAPIYTYELRAFGRPAGALVMATVAYEQEDGNEVNGTLMVALDDALAPVSQSFLGPGTWVRSIGPHPDGTTVVTVDFSELLELGPIGVGGNGPAVAEIDDQGQGRWAELLHSEQSGDITWAAAASDGAALVGGYVDPPGGVLAGGVVDGGFVAKLRP
jgi:hypothetical protein